MQVCPFYTVKMSIILHVHVYMLSIKSCDSPFPKFWMHNVDYKYWSKFCTFNGIYKSVNKLISQRGYVMHSSVYLCNASVTRTIDYVFVWKCAMTIAIHFWRHLRIYNHYGAFPYKYKLSIVTSTLGALHKFTDKCMTITLGEINLLIQRLFPWGHLLVSWMEINKRKHSPFLKNHGELKQRIYVTGVF